MRYTVHKVNESINVITFGVTATNHKDGRQGSALELVSYANEKAIGGFSDWVLPSKETLLDLCQLSEKENEENKHYWSSSLYVGYASGAWFVYFNHGGVYSGDRSSYYYVRLVRASQLYDIGLAVLNKRFGVVNETN